MRSRTLSTVGNANHRRPRRGVLRASAAGKAGSRATPAAAPPPQPSGATPRSRAAQREAAAARQEVHQLSTAEPLDVDGTKGVGIGTALWAVAGLVLLVGYRDDLTAADSQWWLWTCVAGIGLGLLGWTYCRRRRERGPH